MSIAVIIFVALSVFLILYFLIGAAVPFVIHRYGQFQAQRTVRIVERLEDSFIYWEKKKLLLLSLSPIIIGGLGFLLLRNLGGALGGFIVGLAFPTIMVRTAKSKRLRRFQGQLADGLMILSSSLKGGLSLIQAIEVLCEEMPAPISQEFGLVLKQNRLGMSLEESFRMLLGRVSLEEVNLLVSSILIARETGGDLTKVLNRLSATIRNNVKLKEKVTTLTLQGRLQGIIMSLLPVGFAYFIYRQNPEHFDIMWQSNIGRTLIFAAIFLELIGAYMIKKISTVKI